MTTPSPHSLSREHENKGGAQILFTEYEGRFSHSFIALKQNIIVRHIFAEFCTIRMQPLFVQFGNWEIQLFLNWDNFPCIENINIPILKGKATLLQNSFHT